MRGLVAERTRAREDGSLGSDIYPGVTTRLDESESDSPTHWPGAVDKVAFSVSGRPFTWRDAIAHARATGAWETLERQTAEGVALLHTRGQSGPPPDDLREAANAFRYERNLVAAEELEAWLDHWEVTVDEWMDHIRRTVLRKDFAEDLPSSAPQHSGNNDEITARLWSSAVCSGILERAAEQLAGLRAVCDGLAEKTGAAVEPLRARTELRSSITEQELKAEVQNRVLEWVRVDAHVLAFLREDAAREAVALLVQDGLSATEVADLARASLEHRSGYLEEIEEERRLLLTGSTKGDVLGPFEEEHGWQVIVVLDKVSPSLDDPEVRSRAEESIVERAIRRETDERVVWHGYP